MLAFPRDSVPFLRSRVSHVVFRVQAGACGRNARVPDIVPHEAQVDLLVAHVAEGAKKVLLSCVSQDLAPCAEETKLSASHLAPRQCDQLGGPAIWTAFQTVSSEGRKP